MRRNSDSTAVGKRFAILTSVVALAAIGGLAAASDKLLERDLRLRRPVFRILREGIRNVAVFGEPMAKATTRTGAARSWIEQYGERLGVTNLDLRADFQARTTTAGATVLAYRQYMDGLPVEGGIARVLVEDGQPYFVSYAGAKLARRPKGSFPPDRVNAADAFDSVRDSAAYGHLTQWTQPELVVYQSETGSLRSTAYRTWKFVGFDSDTTVSEAYTFFVNAADGSLVQARSEIYHQVVPDISGTVTAFGSPGMFPASIRHPVEELALSDLPVSVDTGQVTVTDADGSYTLNSTGVVPVTLTAELEGPWVRVRDDTGPILTVTGTVDEFPATLDLQYNLEPTEQTTAQVDAFIHTNRTYNFFKTHHPEFTRLDLQLTAHVNRGASCNAFYTPIGPSINFLAAGNGCVNTAYSSVVSHEYGHFIVHRLGLLQGSFGEGFGDVVTMMMNNDPVIGRNFFGTDEHVRDNEAANEQYPCFGEVHDCGQVLAGVWWDLNLEMQALMGEEEGLAYTQGLFVDWALITVGGAVRNSAHRQTALEVLVVDDDNANLLDGVPHKAQICAAFDAHNISCPDVCPEVKRVRASCRSDGAGGYKVRAVISTSSGSGTDLRTTLDGQDEQVLKVSRLGRVVANWPGVDAGTHEVCIEGCNTLCEEVTCGR